MTTKQDLIRAKLQSKIFNVFGKSVTLKKKDAPTYNDRGEEVDTEYTSSDITIVPYNVIEQEQSYQAFGELIEGDMDAAVPYDISIDEGDLIEMDEIDYKVRSKAINPLPENVVTIIRLTRVQP